MADTAPRGCRPATKTTGREPFVAQPKALPVVHQDLHRGAATVAKNVGRARERIGRQTLAARTGHPVDASPEVHRLDRYQYAHLRCDLDHARRLQNSRAKPGRSSVSPAARRTANFAPLLSVSSSVAPAGPVANGNADQGQRRRPAVPTSPLWRPLVDPSPSPSASRSLPPEFPASLGRPADRS